MVVCNDLYHIFVKCFEHSKDFSRFGKVYVKILMLAKLNLLFIILVNSDILQVHSTPNNNKIIQNLSLNRFLNSFNRVQSLVLIRLLLSKILVILIQVLLSELILILDILYPRDFNL